MIELVDVSYSYPHQPMPAVNGINLKLSPGQALLCTGASGSGKSTLVRLLNGLAPHFYKGRLHGQVRVMGSDTTSLSLQGVSDQVGTLFQNPEHQFFALNVEDEIATALEWKGMKPTDIGCRVHEMAERFQLQHIMDSSVLSLSEGQKQKVALAGVLARKPGLLVLDEPTANLDPESTRELAEILRVVKQHGIAIVVVDHRLYWLEGLIDQAVIMEKGEISFQGSFQDLHSSQLQNHYGLRATRVSDPRQSLPDLPESDPHVSLRNISFSYYNDKPIFNGLSFDLPQCSVVGLLGPNGAGKTTLARLLVGLLKLAKGKITINNQQIPPKDLLARTSIVLQNMDHQLHMRTVRQELITALGTGARHSRTEMVDEMLDRFNLAHLDHRHPQSLSGGEKQRLVIACGMIREPEILILDEPTSGLDGKNMAIIAQSLKQCAARESVVLVISHDLELLEMACTHRLVLKPA